MDSKPAEKRVIQQWRNLCDAIFNQLQKPESLFEHNSHRSLVKICMQIILFSHSYRRPRLKYVTTVECSLTRKKETASEAKKKKIVQQNNTSRNKL